MGTRKRIAPPMRVTERENTMAHPVIVYCNRKADIYVKWNLSATYYVFRISTHECLDCFTNYTALIVPQASQVAIHWCQSAYLSD